MPSPHLGTVGDYVTDGTFSAPVIQPLSDQPVIDGVGPEALVVTDIDGDGDADVAVALPLEGRVVVLRNGTAE